MEYYVWSWTESDESIAWIKDWPDEINEHSWKLSKGTSCKEWFPSDSELKICSEEGIRLTDAIPNYSNKLVISEKLKLVLEEHSGAHFEYFPVTMLDKKGRPDKHPYYVANLLEVVDCVDMEASSYIMDSIIKDQVMYFKELILDESKIPVDKPIFRLKDKTDLIIINDPLSDAILDAGCEGAFFQDLDDHGSVHRD